jgi:hypothetical protein
MTSPYALAERLRCAAGLYVACMVAKGGGPKGECNGAYRTGRYTHEAKAERRATRALLRQLRELIDTGG